MTKVIVIYLSRTGHTRSMAEYVAEGARETGAEVEIMTVEELDVRQVETADVLLIGSPTHYGQPGAAIQKFFEDSVKLHSKLQGKVGGAFTSSHNIGGGNETALLTILHAMLVHGMIIQGKPDGDHYGPVAIGVPDRRAASQCRELGRRTAALATQLRQS